MSNTFNPEIIVHNGEGLTLTARPSQSIFAGTNGDVDLELKFKDGDIDGNNEVKYKNAEIGRNEISDDLFHRTKQPMILTPVDGSSNWDGSFSYEVSIGQDVIDNSILKVQLCKDLDFNDVYEETLTKSSGSVILNINDICNKFGLGTTINVRIFLQLPDGNILCSAYSRVALYDITTKPTFRFVLDSTRDWSDIIKYEVDILESLKNNFTLTLELSTDINFSSPYTESLDINLTSGKTNFKEVEKKFGFGTRVFGRIKLEGMSRTIYSDTTDTIFKQLTITLGISGDLSNFTGGAASLTYNIDGLRRNEVFVSQEIEFSKSSSFSSIRRSETIGRTSVSYSIDNSLVQDLGMNETFYVRTKTTTSHGYYFSNIIFLTTFGVSITIEMLNETINNSSLWGGVVKYILPSGVQNILSSMSIEIEIGFNSIYSYGVKKTVSRPSSLTGTVKFTGKDLGVIQSTGTYYARGKVIYNRSSYLSPEVYKTHYAVATDKNSLKSMLVDYNYPAVDIVTRQVVDMSNMWLNFRQSFPDIRDLDVSHTVNMSAMFSGTSFNQDISGWDTRNVEDTSFMFFMNGKFNKPIGNWNMSNVRNLRGMFGYSTEFNQPLNNWNLTNAETIKEMFSVATKFNQPLNNWNTSNISNMYGVFWNASSFNQDISMWNVNKVSDWTYIFESCPISQSYKPAKFR